MLSTIVGLSEIAGVAIGVSVSYVWFKSRKKHRFLEVLAKAKAIESEALLHQKEAEVSLKEKSIFQERLYEKRVSELDDKESLLGKKEHLLYREEEQYTREKKRIEEKEIFLEKLERHKQDEINRTIHMLENVAGLSKEEAKQYILEEVEKQSRAEVAHIVRRYEQEAKEDGERKANYILAQATTRYAGEFAGERLINVVTLPTDEHKGRIIGKEGRNIKSLEMLLGVDIIIDETPNTLLVSSFNLYRRAIATRVIEVLILDGRIHPGRIEEVHSKVESEFEQKMYEEGENILMDLGIFPMHEELVTLLGRMKYRASYGQNALGHTLEVAKLAAVMAVEMGGDEKLALRAGLLHDIGKALTQDIGGSHVDIGVELCRKHREDPRVINAILAHHGHEEPNSIESAAVCAADTLSAARPGARREVQEDFVKRVKEIEDIALAKPDVEKAYAIHAGREIRIFVNAQKMGDNEAALLSHEIAKEIEEKVQYPGTIKVNVIRELRVLSYAT